MFPAQNSKKKPKWKFSEKNNFLESVSLEGNKAFFYRRSGKILVEKWQSFLPGFRKKRCLRYFEKINFTSKSSSGHVATALLTTLWKIFAENLNTFHSKPGNRWETEIVSKNFLLMSFSERLECSISNHAEMFQP